MKEASQKLIDLILEATKAQSNILESAKSYAKSYSDSIKSGLFASEKDAIKSFRKDISEWRFIQEANLEGDIKLRNIKWEEIFEYFNNLDFSTVSTSE